MTLSRRRRLALLVIVATTAAAAFFAVPVPPKAQAFFGSVHERILRDALPRTQYFPDDGVDDTALNEIIGSQLDGTGNVGSDNFQGDDFRHFDSAGSPAAICKRNADAWNTFMPIVIDGAQPAGPPDFKLLTNGPAARSAFGALTHALADFYSHSNWIELNIAANQPQRLAPIFPTCDKDALPAGLHTGFFSLLEGNVDGCPDLFPLPTDQVECHLTLNKDTDHSRSGKVEVPALGGIKQHLLAVSLAIRHTAELYWQVRSIVAGSFTPRLWGVDGECVARNLFQANRFEPCAVCPPGRPCGVVGERCSSDLVGVDKNTREYIVCVYSRDYRPDGVWVTGNIVGVHNIGEPCDPTTDRASQTPAFKPILCVQGQGWRPGP